MIPRAYCCRARNRVASSNPVLAGVIVLILSMLAAAPGLGASVVRADGGTTYTVGTTADDDGTSTAECDNPTNTTCTLRSAIALATSGADTIEFNATGTGTITLGYGPGQGDLKLQHSVSIVGPGSSALRVDGNGDFNAEQIPPLPIGVFEIRHSATVTISGLTVQNGNGFTGGAISNDGTLFLTDSAVLDSHAGGGGGGIFNAGTLTLTGTTVRDNRSGSSGGGIASSGGLLTLIDSAVIDNFAATSGGGISQQSGTLILTGSTLHGNTASNFFGGGVFNQDSTTTVTNSTFTDNTARLGDGGAIFNQSTLIIVGSTFTGNTASGLGGVIRNDATHTDATVMVTNSTFTGNSASNGNGFFSSGALTITNSTISNNPRKCDINGCYSGGGIWNSGGTLHLTNSIVDGNTNADVLGTITTNSHNVIGTAGGPALLGTLGNYGGSTDTIPLLPGSAAIGAGDAAVCADISGTGAVAGRDQRGVARPAGSCDIGAFQSQGFTLSTISGDNQNAELGFAFANPLVVAVTASAAGALYSEPVQGGVVTFTGPVSGAGIQSSPLTASIAANGQASTSVTANETAGGPYSVVVTAAGAAASVTFSLTNNAIAFCEPGFFSASGIAPCTPAPAGSYVSGSGATSATLCGPGTYSDVAGAATCTPAPAGSYVATSGATSATLCDAGSYQVQAGQTSCTPVPAGSYVSGTGATAPSPCPAGSFSASSGATACTPAPPGTYVDSSGATAATTCPSGTTSTEGATSCDIDVVAPQITSANAVSFDVGAPHSSFQMTASGNPAPTFSVSGELPDGITLSPSGLLSGTTAVDGVFVVTIMASNGVNPDATQTFTLTTVPPVIIPHDDILVANDPGVNGAAVSYLPPLTTGYVGVVTCLPLSSPACRSPARSSQSVRRR